jgi:hypothetical protein
MIQVENPFEAAVHEAARNHKEWSPFPKQKSFIQLPFDITEGFFGGAAGPGKSELLVLLPLIYRFHEHPLYKGILLRRTFPELESEIIIRSRQFYPSAGAVYNESKRRWTFPRGGIEQFGHCEREQDVRKYDSAEYNLVKYDEATSFLPFQYLYLVLTRRRSKTSDLPAIARSASNPGNIGHLFFRKRFIDPFPAGGRVINDRRTGSRRYFLQALGTDNPVLLKNNPNYFNQMKDLGDAEYRAKALGDWYTFSGQAFPEWRLEPLPGEPDNARHVIDGTMPIPKWWPKFIAIDWGWKAWTFIIWAALSPDNRIYIYRTYAEKEKYTKTWVSEMINLSGDELDDVIDIGICHSAAQHRGEPLTIQEQVQEAFDDRAKELARIYSEENILGNPSDLSHQIRLGKRDRIGGKLLVHEALRWQHRDKITKHVGEYDEDFAQWLRRNKGEKYYLSYLDQFIPEIDEANIPRLQIVKYSPEGRENAELIDTIPSCKYVEKGEKDKSPEDVAEFDGDDPYDCLRILLEKVDNYVNGVVSEDKIRTQRQKIVKRLEESGDYHSYALAVQKLHSENEGHYNVRRFHRHQSVH